MQFGIILLLKKRKISNSIYKIYREQVIHNSNILLLKNRTTLILFIQCIEFIECK